MSISSFRYALPSVGGSPGVNALVLGLTFPHGNTPTITDNNGNTWNSTPVVSADAGVGNYITAIYVLPNPNTGLTTLNVAFSGGLSANPFQYTISEFANLDPSPVGNTSSNTAASGASTLSTGNFTPGAGNLVWNYYGCSASPASTPSGFTPGGSFVLLDADISWSATSSAGQPHACQYLASAPSGGINPSTTVTGGSGANYNCLAVALKAKGGTPTLIQHVSSTCDPPGLGGGVGGPPGDNYKIPLPNPCGATSTSGLYINKVIHFTSTPNHNSAYSWPIIFPCVGNFRIICFQTWASGSGLSGGGIPVNSVTDSESNTWTLIELATDEPIFAYMKNTSSNPNLVVTINFAANSGLSPSIRCYDISGAHATSPIDATAGLPTTSTGGTTSISHAPDLVVPTSGDLVLATAWEATGPGFTMTSSSGTPIFDLCTFAGETDANLIENADLCGHIYNVPATTLNIGWTFTNVTTNGIGATAVAIKSA